MSHALDKIDTSTLAQRIGQDGSLVLLEALPAKYFAQGHLPGASLLPPGQEAELAASLIPNLDAEVVIYCASDTCRNSDQAAEKLQALGYRNVRVYPDGKAGWREAGHPIES